MKKQLLTITIVFLCGILSAQIYTPVYPTTYGNNFLRVKAQSVLHVPESLTTDLNTTDFSAQIRSVGGHLWFYNSTTSTWIDIINSSLTDSSFSNGFTTRKRFSKDSLAIMNAIGLKGTVLSITTGYGLSGGTITTSGTIKIDSSTILPLSSITLNTSGNIHTNPINFTRVGGSWSGTMSLATQSAYTIFGRGIGNGTPSFITLDSNYFVGGWRNGISGAILSYANTWTGKNTFNNNAVTIGGNDSLPAWTTNGVKLIVLPIRLKDTTSSGTVTNAYSNYIGGDTVVTKNATTFTNYYTKWIGAPVNGTNATITNKYSLGLGGGFYSTGTAWLAGGLLVQGSNCSIYPQTTFYAGLQNQSSNGITNSAGYATAGIPYTAPYYQFVTYAWNGSNGYTYSSYFNIKALQNSASNQDVDLVFANNITEYLRLKQDKSLVAQGAITTPKLNINTGSNASAGTATLSSGTVTVSTTAITSNSHIHVNYKSGTALSGTSSILVVTSIVNSTSFTVTAINAGSTTTNTSDNNQIEYDFIN